MYDDASPVSVEFGDVKIYYWGGAITARDSDDEMNYLLIEEDDTVFVSFSENTVRFTDEEREFAFDILSMMGETVTPKIIWGGTGKIITLPLVS